MELSKRLNWIVGKLEKSNVIMRNSRTGEKGAFGDGKIFVSPVEEAYTVSSGKAEL